MSMSSVVPLYNPQMFIFDVSWTTFIDVKFFKTAMLSMLSLSNAFTIKNRISLMFSFLSSVSNSPRLQKPNFIQNIDTKMTFKTPYGL